MKALIIRSFTEPPTISEDFPMPSVDRTYSVLVKVLAVPIENLDRAVAAGTHYSSSFWHQSFPSIPGASAIGRRVDNQHLVYLPGMSMRPGNGAMAEYTVAKEDSIVDLEETQRLSSMVASLSSAQTSLLPLKYDQPMSPSDTVIINGATGFAGKLAVQVARHLGIRNIIATGRSEERLTALRGLGATQSINTNSIQSGLAQSELSGNVSIIDYLWGSATTAILRSLIPTSPANLRQTILYEIGSAAHEPEITLPATAIRTSGVQIRGLMTLNNLKNRSTAMRELISLLGSGVLQGDTEDVTLEDAADIWRKAPSSGIRNVIRME
ncbi:hypothetical protein [Bifidobacterium sp.]|uniref:hypothetical protein n=1 Tax=Bifidobacterium sp. TaxID=41200 RepID=UPI0039E7898F